MKAPATAAALLPLFLAVPLAASPIYQTRIPNGGSVEHDGSLSPAVGHMTYGSKALNPFGTAFKDAGYVWTVALCQADSDGDGLTNGYELGDPDCVWAPGLTPARITDITHPGFVTVAAGDDDDDDEDGNEEDAGLAAGQAPAQAQLTLPSWLVWHIVLMQVSWGFLLPLGALIAISFRGKLGGTAAGGKPWWFVSHIACQVLGLACMIGGFVVPIVNIGAEFDDVHKLFGVAIVAIGCVQGLMGFIRPHKPDKGEDKTMLRSAWEVVHKYLVGRTVIALAWTNIFLGAQLVKNDYEGVPGTDNIFRGMNVVLGVQAGLVTVLTAVSVFYKSTPPSDEKNENQQQLDKQIEGEMNDTTRAFSVDQSMPRKGNSSSDEEV